MTCILVRFKREKAEEETLCLNATFAIRYNR